MMHEADVEDAAQVLAEMRRTGRLMKALPPSLVPPDVESGYRVQDAFIRTWGQHLVGWKVGATAGVVQKRFGIAEPFAGPFFAPDVMASPARAAAARFPHLVIECEFAFRVGRTVEPQPAPARAEVVQMFDAVVPAIEIVGTRFDSLLFHSVPTAIADCALDAGFVLGEPVSDWRRYDYPAHPVALSVDGKLKAEGAGSAVLGDPLAVLEWAVRHLGSRGIALSPGDIISTGTTTGLTYLEPGEVALADFGPLGTVELGFVGPRHATPVLRA